MKNLFLIGLVMLLLGCDTEVDVIYEADTVPIVYCLLDPGKEIQTIRLSKSYLTNQGQYPPDSADMLYYQTEVELAVEKVVDNQAIDHTKFNPVVISKEPGYFPGKYHIIYQAKLDVQTNTVYRLVVYLPTENKVIYSFTRTVGHFSIVDPRYPEVRPLHFSTDHNPVFHWTPAENASIYQLFFQLNYIETDSVQTTLKSIMLPIKTIVKRDNPGPFFIFDINSTQFYITLGESLPPSKSLIRTFNYIDAFIIAGGEELAVHFQSEREGDPFRIIDYTNIQNGIGVFSSIAYSYCKGFKVTNQTIDSIAYGQFTKQLNFLDRNGNRKDQ
ncbi:MAG: DUF4249 family protein [Bacteroidales bacterium]|nr:DUF4249 family protein [Bacteroidales bacterium]